MEVTGFLKDAVTAGIAVTIYDREGDFQKDERLIFSRTNTNGSTIARVATAVTAHSLSDVKSVFGSLDGTVGLQTFSADVIQSTAVNVGIATITAFLVDLAQLEALIHYSQQGLKKVDS